MPDRDLAVDVKGVRRQSAPVDRPYTRGSRELALHILSSAGAKKQAVANLRGSIFARSTIKPMQDKRRTLNLLCTRAGFKYLPADVYKLEVICATLREAGYRSVAGYIDIWRRDHREAGLLWDQGLQLASADFERACGRGLGPARRAFAFKAETLDVLEGEVVVGSKAAELDFVVFGVVWLLRGAELAANAVQERTANLAMLALGTPL